MIEEAIRIAEQIKTEEVPELSPNQLKEIISLIDYTTLNDTDTEESVYEWMQNSIALMNAAGVYCGGWCVFPNFISVIRDHRKEIPISIAVVNGNFPSGMAKSQIKIEEAVLSESEGAEEIDTVVNKGWSKDSQWQKIEKEISLIKGALAHAHLKVIMETGMLDPEQVDAISRACIRGGADFIKTSTGKTEHGASLESVSIMCHIIKEHYQNTGKKIGIKPSGGISEPEEAFLYVKLVRSILGDEWINNSLFRIGASRLLNNTINKLNT